MPCWETDIYTYPNAFGHLVSKYMWLWGYISKIHGVVAYFTTPSGERRPLELKYPYGVYIILSLTL